MTSITEWIEAQKKLLAAAKNPASVSWDVVQYLDCIISVRTEHERALKIIEELRDALNWYQLTFDGDPPNSANERFASALAYFPEVGHDSK